RPGVAGSIRRAWKRIGSTKATEPPHLGQTLLLRGITAVVADALTGIGRAPASAGPRRLAPLRARPALGVSVGEQQSHYCDTEKNKTDRAHGSSPTPSFGAANAKGEAASPPSKPMNSRRCTSMTPSQGLCRVYQIEAACRFKYPVCPKADRLVSLRTRRRASTSSHPRIPLRPRHSASLRAFAPIFDGLWTRVNALRAGLLFLCPTIGALERLRAAPPQPPPHAP